MSVTTVVPDVRRADVAAVFVGQVHVGDADAASSVLAELTRQWELAPPVAGVHSVGVYLDTTGETVLVYVQSGLSQSWSTVIGDVPAARELGVGEYRLRRSVVPTTGTPGSVVIATFDVDGPVQQDAVIATLTATLEGRPAAPGMLSAHFHASVDGTRVLNYAEWTTDEAHEAFLAGETRSTTLRVSTGLPGVRPIGFRRYHLWSSPVR